MRYGLFITTVLAGTCLSLISASAQVQLSQQWASCTGKSDVDWDKQIESCTLLISSSFETVDHRVIAYIRRGIAYYNKGDIDRAITDYNAAIGSNPKNAQAYSNRGNAYWSKGENGRAVADFDKAIELNPKDAAAYRSRGLVFLYSGDPAKALADVMQASKLNSRDPYNALWADIVGQRDNVPSHLSQSTAQVDMSAWPAPVIHMFLGEATPASVLAAAEAADGKLKKGEVCEAEFYSGEWTFRTGAKEEATRLYRLAASDCPRDFLEWSAANAELKTSAAAP